MTLEPRDLGALILAAGSGVRMGQRPKAFLEAGGETLEEFQKTRNVSMQYSVAGDEDD